MRPFLAAGLVLALCAAAARGPAQEPRPRRDDPSTWKWCDAQVPQYPGLTHHLLKSKVLGQDVGFNVVVPEVYAGGSDRYPTIYFLHGAGGNENSDAVGFASLIRREQRLGRVPPTICVFPNGALSGYRDSDDGKIRAETMVVEELLPEVDRLYRTKARRDGRALAGFSMGGGGAVRLLIRHPERFCAAASWGGALREFGGEAATALLERQRELLAGRAHFLLIVGGEDFTREGHTPFVDRARALNLDVDFRILPGVGHSLGLYYERTGADLARFLGEALRTG